MSAPAPSDTKTIRVSTLEGKPVYRRRAGGQAARQRRGNDPAGDFLRRGVGTPLHSHTHKSVIYLVSGKLKGTIDGKEIVMLPAMPAGIRPVSCIAWKRWRTP